MSDLLTKLYTRFGMIVIIGAFLIVVLIWYFVHLMSPPGERISVLWGLVEYTKQPREPTNNNAIQNKVKKIDEKKTVMDEKKTVMKDVITNLPPTTLKIINGVKEDSSPSVILREQDNLRQLTALESDRPISKTPYGTHFYVFAGYLELKKGEKISELLNSPVNRFAQTNSYFEFHYKQNGEIELIGYGSESEMSKVGYLDGSTQHSISLSPIPHANATSMMRVPITRILSASYRDIELSETKRIGILDLLLQ